MFTPEAEINQNSARFEPDQQFGHVSKEFRMFSVSESLKIESSWAQQIFDTADAFNFFCLFEAILLELCLVHAALGDILDDLATSILHHRTTHIISLMISQSSIFSSSFKFDYNRKNPHTKELRSNSEHCCKIYSIIFDILTTLCTFRW